MREFFQPKLGFLRHASSARFFFSNFAQAFLFTLFHSLPNPFFSALDDIYDLQMLIVQKMPEMVLIKTGL